MTTTRRPVEVARLGRLDRYRDPRGHSPPDSSRTFKMMTWRAGYGSFAGIFAGEQRRTEGRRIERSHAQIER